MNKKNLKKIKRRLMQRRKELCTEIDRFRDFESSILNYKDIGDLQDEATRDLGKETAWTITEMEFKELVEVEAALEKMEMGEYGICDICGKTITFRRLFALPSARLCIDCQKKKELYQGIEEDYAGETIHNN